MKQRSHKRRLLTVALLLALVLTCGSVYAYMFMRTPTQGVSFIPASVTCEVDAPVADNTISSIKLENTGNVKEYLRVRLVTYWVDEHGNVAPKTSPTLTVSYDTGNWVKSATSNTFYYKVPVPPDAPDDFTTNLLTGPITLATEDGYKQVVDIFGEAIQAEPTTAVTDSWHVTLSGTTVTAAP